MAKTNIRGSQIADGADGVNLAVDVTGTLPAGNGGTGLASPGTAGNVLTSTGTGWTSTAPTGGLNLASLPLYVYGNSYAIVPGYSCTAGNEWPTKVKVDTAAPSVTSYAISGTRIADAAFPLIDSTTSTAGISVPNAAAKWPGVSSRTGICFLDFMFNDVGHYTTSANTPVAISPTDSRYINGVAAMYRMSMAMISSESRVEQTTATATGSWTLSSSTTYSGGSMSYTSTPGSSHQYSITPPQEGPLAGRVFFLCYTLASTAGTMSAINIAMDGTLIGAHTPIAWESYSTATGALDFIPYVIPVDLPIDGAAHTITFTHAGVSGQFMYSDAILVPSENPNPILVLEASWVKTGAWNSTQVATWRSNLDRLYPVIRDVVEEFPNGVWVPSNITANGLYSVDGIHPNDRGQAQRTADVENALQEVAAWVKSRTLSLASDASFGVV